LGVNDVGVPPVAIFEGADLGRCCRESVSQEREIVDGVEETAILPVEPKLATVAKSNVHVEERIIAAHIANTGSVRGRIQLLQTGMKTWATPP
jgi:hypothetical protein